MSSGGQQLDVLEHLAPTLSQLQNKAMGLVGDVWRPKKVLFQELPNPLLVALACLGEIDPKPAALRCSLQEQHEIIV